MGTPLIIGISLFLVTSTSAAFGQAPDYKDAIFVAKSTERNGSSSPVQFDYVGVDARKSFDPKTSRFFAHKAGYYWTAISAGARANYHLSYALMRDETNKMASLDRASFSHNGVDTLSRDIIAYMGYLGSLNLDNSWGGGLYSDGGYQTSFSTFRLTDLLKKTYYSPSYYFSVTRTTQTNGSVSEIISFPNVIANEGNAYDTANHYFKVPKTGLYFFSFSAGILRSTAYDSVLRRNVTPMAALARRSTSHNDIDTISRAVMLSLTTNDRIFISINKSSKAYSDKGHQTSFSGFFYDPVHNFRHAWSVARKTSWADDLFLAPIPFDDVLVNDDSQGWYSRYNVYITSVTGYYYITFSVGAQAGKPVHVSLFVDGHRKADILRTCTTHNGVDLLSRSVIVRATANSTIYLGAEANTAFYSSSDREVAFSGFLIFPV